MKRILLILFLFVLVPLTAGAQSRLSTELLRARSLFEHGRWADARHQWLQIKATTPDRQAEADYHLALCAVKLGAKDADALLAGFMLKYPESLYRNDVHFELGLLYCTREEYGKAREHLEKVRYSALGSVKKEQYDLRMGYIAFGEGNYDEALKYHDRIPPQSEYHDHALYYRSYIAYDRERYAEAKTGFEQLLGSAAYADVVPFYLLQIEFRQGNYRYVIEHGDELIARSTDPHRIELHRVMAESHFHLEDYRQTIHHLVARQQLAGGETTREEEYLYGFSFYRLVRYDEALPHLRAACGPDDALTQNASYHLADCYLRVGDKQSAMQSFAMAGNAAYDTDIAEDALFNYGKLQFELGGGLFNEAIGVLTRYVEKYPASPRVATAKELLAAAYYNSRNYDAAYRIISSHPDPDGELRAVKQKITYFRGLSALEQGRPDEAARYLSESARIDVSPRYTALAAFWQGEIACGKSDYAAAGRYYDDFLKRAPKGEPEYAMAWYGKGYACFSQDKMTDARAAFQQFLPLDPAVAYRTDARNRVADTYYAQRQFDEALRLYTESAATDDYARYRQAVTLGIMSRTAEKIDRLKQIRTGNYLDDATYELGHTYIAQEQYRRGVEVLEPFVNDFPESPLLPAALSDLGLAYLNLGENRNSLAAYDRVVKGAPQSTEAKDAMQGIRDIYVAQGDAAGYFAYAEKSGVESNLDALSRDSLTFAAARRVYLSGEPDTAAKSLRSYLTSYPKGYYRNDALYFLSDCYLKTNDRGEAIGTLTTLSEPPVNSYTVRALKTLSKLAFAEKRYAESAEAYRKLADRETTAAAKGDAMSGYARATIATGDDDAILKMADDIAATAGSGDRAWRESQFAKAGILAKKGDGQAAQKTYKLLSTSVQDPEGAESAYRVIESAYRSGDAAQAERLIKDFAAKDTPQTYWLAKSFLTLGDIYLQKGDAFQARATYQSIVDGYSPADDGIVAEAKTRIGSIKN